MQFMADIHLTCEVCKGSRYKQETLEVTFEGKTIADVLDMTVDESVEFFKDEDKIYERLEPLARVGLGYIKLGQSASTLSGGEAQRIKLATYLSKSGRRQNGMMFIFDEPTTGLHFQDIKKLLNSLHELVENGNTVIVIEHNLEVVKTADHVIDLGPEGGDEGGQIVFEGTPEALAKSGKGYTAGYLKEKLK